MNFLRTQARWFVALAWLMLILTFAMSILVGMSSGISVFYHPLHRYAPFDRAYLEVAEAAFYAAIIAALGSSVALLLRRRLLASASVLLILAVFPIGAMVRLSLIEPGPYEFQRYIGDERFIIPWTFNPRGSDKPSASGFAAQLCVENLRGNYDPECRNTTQLTAAPRQRGFLASFDMDFFQKHVGNMNSIAPRNNHQGYEYTSPSDSKGKVRAERYYILRDGEGQPIRLTKCYEFGICAHTALIDRYRLDYSMKDAPGADWQAQDRNLADLITSWRVPDSN